MLAEYFQPEPREISKALRNVKAQLLPEEPVPATPGPAADATTPAASAADGENRTH